MKQKASLARRLAGGEAVPLRLPPGFRFHPTDEELVLQYLRRKAFDAPLPAAVIPEIDLLKFNPWDLLEVSGEERYFFNLKEAKYVNGNRANRATSAGYWKATGKEKAVSSSRVNQVVGMKRALVFYQGKAPRGERTDWIMHEYRLAGAGIAPSRLPQQANANASQEAVVPSDAWVLCRIFKKMRAGKADSEMEDEQTEAQVPNGNVRYFDFLGVSNANRRRHGASPVSSCVTDLSEEHCKGEETSSRRVGSSV